MSIEIKKVKIDVDSLEIGMKVCELDIPWNQTTFPLQGFTIRNQNEINQLTSQCQFVYIDQTFYDNKSYKKDNSVNNRKQILQNNFQTKLKVYKDAESWKVEFPKAKASVEALSKDIKNSFSNFLKSREFNIEKMKQSVDPMIDSISRNPDACIWLARMKKEDNYTYERSLSTSIWAVALGRQLGLPKSDLKSLAVGALLLDVGKLEIDPNLLNAKRKLTPDEFNVAKTHVNHSLKLVKNTKGLNKNILCMIAQHHERFDGKGYPQNLAAEDINVFARIAALVDCYDAITSNRPYAKAITPTDAIKYLYKARGKLFQAELVEEFIQAIGIYPAGSLVELSTGEVAIVLAEYRSRRLRPEVLVLLDKDKKRVQDTVLINLFEKTHDAGGNPIDISKSLEPGAYGIKMDSINL
jgi:HD-GYP domain-containing protein (c-di-GMP phosphodiesterase class II)